MLLIRFVLCATISVLLLLQSCLVSPSSDVHTVLPESYGGLPESYGNPLESYGGPRESYGRPAPPDTGPYDGDEYGVRNYVSEHELPRDVPTRVQVVGDLGTPPPSVKLDFTPQQTYVQVRRYDAVKRLPQEAAMQEAATSEEAANAPRLREVVTHKKTQEVYEEQGYEDAGYDHGGSKKLKVEEEVKDNQSEELYRPNNGSSAYDMEETRDHGSSVAPSGRGTWTRHKTTTGKKTKYEDDGDRKRKVTVDDSSPVSEKTSGNYTKFDGGKTIVVQNLTQTEKKEPFKKDAAESRRVASFSRNRGEADYVEPTTYRPVMRHDHDSPRPAFRTSKNNYEQHRTNRTRGGRPRKRQESNSNNNVQKTAASTQQAASDVQTGGSYDHGPWIPISPPTDYQGSSGPAQFEEKKPAKSSSITHSEHSSHHEPGTKFGYTINHEQPYQYVFPTDLLAPESAPKPHRKSRPKPADHLQHSDGGGGGHAKKPVVETSYGSHEFVPQTNYDGSAIKPKQKKVTKSSREDVPPPADNINQPSIKRYKEPPTQFQSVFTGPKQLGAANSSQRQKTKPAAVHTGSAENVKSSNLKLEPSREQQKKINKINKDIEEELANFGNSGTLYKSVLNQDLNPPQSYDAPFITRAKKNNYNGETRGDPTLRIYPKYEIHPFPNLKHSIKDEPNRGYRPVTSFNKGYATIEQIENVPRPIKHESTRLSEYPKFNNRPTSFYKPPYESGERWENYPKIRDQTPQLSEQKYNRYNKVDGYPKYEHNKRYEASGTKSSPIFRLIPYEKSVKMNNPYSYVYFDDHYPSGSRHSSVKVDATTQIPKINNRIMNWNNRHPHLPKDSMKGVVVAGDYKGRSDDENARHVSNLTLAHFSGNHKLDAYRPLPLEYNERVNNLAKLLNDNYPKRTRRALEVINIASSGTTTEIPVDTVVYSHYKRAPKESALRYATNPNLTPRKTAGGMEFYASTDKVECAEMSAPEKIVPERNADGEWKGEPSVKSPRVDAVGDTIGCFKTKFFGSDPLDNPIFKEKDVGFPDVLFSKRKRPEKIEKRDPKKPHVEWNFADELIPGEWFPADDDDDKRDRRVRRSDNKSLPINHKITGLESIIPEPVVMTFPAKATPVVYTNVSKTNTVPRDSEVSSNDQHNQHVLKFTITHPKPKPHFTKKIVHHHKDNTIVGLLPPPAQTNAKLNKHQRFKKHTTKKLIKKVQMDDASGEPDLMDVLSPITSIFSDDVETPIVHNFFNINMTPTATLKTITTLVDKNSAETVNQYKIHNFRRDKRNMKGVELQKPRQRKLSIDSNANVSLSSPTARVRVYSPRNGTWFREKRDHRVHVNVDVRRKEPRYYYHTDRPRVRVKRVVHNPPPSSRSGQVFSSKYLVTDQEKSESLPEEINVAFSTSTPKYETTPKFIPAIAFGDSKTKILKYNDSVANSTNNEITQFDKKGSLIYVISPDTGVGKWMQVIKVKNEEGSKTALTNAPVYLEKKVKEGPPPPKDGIAEESFGKFGFNKLHKDALKKALGPTIDHRFNVKFPSKPKELPTKPKELPSKPIELQPTYAKPKELTKDESKTQPKKADCPQITRPKPKKKKKKKEVRRRTTTTTTTEIPVEEEVDERPEEEGEEENAGAQEDGDAGENEDEQPYIEVIERPQYQQESEENADNGNEYEDQDQDVHESTRKKPHPNHRPLFKKPEFKGYYFGSRDRHTNLM